MILNVIGKNKETQEEEVFELKISFEEVGCLYKDRNGVIVTTKQGKSFRVTQKFNDILEQLMS